MKSTEFYEFTFKIGEKNGTITVIERTLEKADKKGKEVLGAGNWNFHIEKIEPTNN